jgi:glycosyltransferase involved in cell wall biosynthesis
MYHLIDAFIVPSKHCVEVLVEGGLPANRMHMIPNFVADEQFREPGERTEARAPMALFVGRLEEAKGIDVLLAAARLVADEIDVVVVGEGPLQRDVQDADRAGSVRYLGRREWSEIAGLMDRASALVVPSLWEENCPMVVLEAGARGCPVIASDRGGLKELISHGHDGLLFPAGHTGALAAALLKLGRDVALSDQLGRAGHLRIVARNTSRGYLEALMDVYERSI